MVVNPGSEVGESVACYWLIFLGLYHPFGPGFRLNWRLLWSRRRLYRTVDATLASITS